MKPHADRKERWIALGFGLPWGWRVRRRGRVLRAWAPPKVDDLPCGHRSIQATIAPSESPEADLLWAASRLAEAVRRHVVDGI